MPIFANNFIAKEGEYSPPPKTEEKKVVLSERKSISFKDIHKKLQEELQPEVIPPKVVEVAKIAKPVEVKKEKPKYHEIHDGDLHKLINRKSTYLTDMIDLEDL